MNTEKICRCCLALDVPLLSIYDGGSAGMGCVADMLKQIAKLKPAAGDNMPEKACLQCISEINRCYVFKMKCENSNRTLRQLLPQAVPESLDKETKEVSFTSVSVQTEDKSLVSSSMQTLPEEKPLLSNRSVQTKDERKPQFCNKEIQTEHELKISKVEKFDNENLITENLIIYEEIIAKPKQRLPPSSPVSNQVSKKLCLESNKINNSLTIEEITESSPQSSNAYIFIDESNMDSNSSEEADKQSLLENTKDAECNRYEYYHNEVIEELPEDEQKVIYEEDDYIYDDNYKTNNQYEMDTSEKTTTTTKAVNKSEEITASKPKSSICTRSSNKPKGQYKCSHCIMTFVSIKVLKRHLINRHDIKDADPIIDEESISYSNCNAKLHNVSEELTAENVAKPQLMPRERVTSTVNEEMLTNIKYFCDYCQAGFAQRKTLTYHMKHQVCMANNFKCDKCERIFVSEENLEAHKLTHENPHKCLECEVVCKTIEELSQHMIDEHNRSARNQCHVCKKVFTMKTSLIDHLRIHSGEKPFLCTICGKSFRQNSNLRQHLIRHTNEKNFKCDMCPNAYVTKAELFSHKRTHTGDQPFKCDICETRFTTSCSLQKHKRKHTGERPYACEFCPMRFAALNVLKNHRRIHTGEKPYKCNYCTKSFTQKGDCLMHERSHIDNVFKCFCKSKFSKKSNFRHHIKTQHPDLNENEIQALLNKSSKGADNVESAANNFDTEYHITLMENSSNDDVEHDDTEDQVFVTISKDNEINSNETSNNNSNEELMEIVMEDVM